MNDEPLERAAGRLIMASIPGPELDPETERLLRSGQAGAVCLFSANVRSPAQLRALCQALRDAAPGDLLIAADLEGGYVWRLRPPAVHFPGAMACGAAGRPDLTRDAARAAGTEMLAQGINFNLAPVVDVNNNPANPVIATRSYGERPDLVAAHAVAAIQGYHAAGVATSAKHFPGHGDTGIDSHLALPTIAHSLDRLRHLELAPFRAAIAAGVDAVMSAHVLFPALDPDLPATLSPRILTGLLREELGFGGVIASDAMNMRAVADRWGAVEGSVLSVIAGADLVCSVGPVAQSAALHRALLAAVAAGRLPEAQVRASALRLAALARRVSEAPAPALEVVGSAAHQRVGLDLAAAAVTLLGGSDTLPLRAGERVAVVEWYSGPKTGAEDTRGLQGALAAAIRHRAGGPDLVTSVLVDAGDPSAALPAAERAAAGAAALVIATRNAWRSEPQLALARHLLVRQPRSALVALRDPYDLRALAAAPCRLAAYCDVPAAVEAVAGVLYGAAAPGTLPVTL